MLNIILYFFSNMIEICALGIYCELLFSPRYSKRTRFILLPVFCIVLFIVSLFRNPLLNISLFAFIFSFYIFTQFKIRWYICLFHTLILTALDSITEMVVAAQNFCHNFSLFLTQIFGKYFRNLIHETEGFLPSVFLTFKMIITLLFNVGYNDLFFDFYLFLRKGCNLFLKLIDSVTYLLTLFA